MSNDDLKYQDSGIIGNIAASNAIWVETYGPRRKKGNVKKSASLRHVAPIDYNDHFLYSLPNFFSHLAYKSKYRMLKSYVRPACFFFPL